MADPTRPPVPAPGRGWARWRWWLVLPVLLLHLVLLQQVAHSRLGWGQGAQAPQRMEVSFVRELVAAAPTAPAPAPPAPAAARLPAVSEQPRSAPRRPAAASAPAPSASASGQAGSAPGPAATAPGLAASVAEDAAAEPLAQAAAPTVPVAPADGASAVRPLHTEAGAPASNPAMATTATATAATIVTAANPAANTATTTVTAANTADPSDTFNWPPSTQLNYRLVGDFRGPVEGTAQVEWLRTGQRYQVRLESSAGPLFRRQVVSEGELGPQGLVPQRLTGEQKVLFAAARRWRLSFGPQQVRLTDGRDVPTLPGAQDEASQFVQLTWLFTRQPELLQVGQSVQMPLAISRKLEPWTFDVVAQETLQLPMGAVPTFHVRPRRAATGGDLTAEMWFAPSLQYLPVRILIRQREGHWVDLSLLQAPLQAAEPAGTAPSR